MEEGLGWSGLGAAKLIRRFGIFVITLRRPLILDKDKLGSSFIVNFPAMI